MKITRTIKSSTQLILSLFLFLPVYLMAQIDWFVPNQIPKAEYIIDLSFDFNNKILEGDGVITFKNTGERTISTIALKYTISDYSLLKVTQNGEILEVYNPDDKKQLNAPVFYILEKPVEQYQDLELQYHFKKALFISEDFQTYETQSLIPELWWDGIAVSKKFKVKINTDQQLKMAVSGRLNKETGYYENDYVNNFGFYFSKTDNVIEEEISGVLVRVLYPENGEDVANLAIKTAKEAIPYYIELMGFYPYSFINIIPGGPGVWGGYPFASGIVVIHGMQLFDQGSIRHWRWITAHEIGHEYWGEYVLDGDDPPFLWIALGIYADREFSQHAGLSDIKHRGWAEYYLDGVKKGLNTTMFIRPDEEPKMDFDRNNYVIHAKGFSFISALEMVMGKETFRQAYRETLDRFGGKRLSCIDFQKVCEDISDENLSWFFDAWLRSNKYLSATIGATESQMEDGKFVSEVSVYHDGEIIMPVPVYATFEDGSFQVQMSGRLNRKEVVTFYSNTRLVGASIDPTGYLANLDENIEFDAETVITNIQMLPYSGAGDRAYLVYRQALSSDREKIAGNWYRLGLALFDAGYLGQAKYAFNYALQYGDGSKDFISNVWLGHVNDLLGNRSSAIEHYQKALELYDGDQYSHSQYNMTIDKSWIEQRLETPFVFMEKIQW